MIYVFTSITNGFDDLRPPAVVSSRAKYICFTNLPNLPRVEPFEYRPLIDLGEASRTNRLPKIMPHLMLPADAEYSIYHDANFTLNKYPEDVLGVLLQHHDWSAHRHPARSCIYAEADVILNHSDMEGWRAQNPNRYSAVASEIGRYRARGYPENSGLWANGMIVRRHTAAVEKLNESWWKLYAAGGERDQLSFPVARRAAGLQVNTINEQITLSSFLNFYFHSAWKDKPGSREFLPQRAVIRERLNRLKALTGRNGFDCPEY